jgi:uncharacterized protein YneF (UPF0154 family)
MWAVVDGESFLISYVVWIIIILAGVYLANRSVKKRIGNENPGIQKSAIKWLKNSQRRPLK